MIGRLFFVIFFCLGGFLFYIPKWILMGTKGSRQRSHLSDQLDAQFKATQKANRLEQEQVRLGNWRPRH
jgi:hypothetical protein